MDLAGQSEGRRRDWRYGWRSRRSRAASIARYQERHDGKNRVGANL